MTASGKSTAANYKAKVTSGMPKSSAGAQSLIRSTAGGPLTLPPNKVPDVKGTSFSGNADDAKITKPSFAEIQTQYNWNLPPHISSLPVDHTYLDGLTVDSVGIGDEDASHVKRRGRIFYYSRVNTSYAGDFQGGEDPRYGFQFLWNPVSFQTSVSVNLDITPTSFDKFVGVVGAFPSGEALSVTIKLDRRNDFFALRSYRQAEGDAKKFNVTSQNLGVLKESYKYGLNSAQDNNETFIKKLNDLALRGTVSDVEYLYKAINGPGWFNDALSKEMAVSSDIGFLTPTLLRIDIGPISYLGYVSSMVVSHIGFTKGMIPIETDVSLSFNLMATAGKASQGKLVSQ
jgi:hypothetical protein